MELTVAEMKKTKMDAAKDDEKKKEQLYNEFKVVELDLGTKK